jgi:hypothetical protein
MANNPQYLLEKIIEIQNIVMEQQQRGVSQMWTYRHLIRPRFFISKGTFKRYMSRNAKRELKELGENVK